MYKIVVTVLLLFAAAGHAQYYSTQYVPISYGYANAHYSGPSANAGVNYFTQRYATVYQKPASSPSSFNFAYSGAQFAPTYGNGPAAGSVNLAFNPTNFAHTYGNGFSAGSVVIAFQQQFQPTYGNRLDFGSINLNLARHELPSYNSMNFGNIRYDFAQAYVQPIYLTPSRALLDASAGFGTYWPPYYY